MPASVALISRPTAPAAAALLLTTCTALTHVLERAYNATHTILEFCSSKNNYVNYFKIVCLSTLEFQYESVRLII